MNTERRDLLADEFTPNSEFDALLKLSTEKINEIPSTRRIELGRYQAKKQAHEEREREQKRAESQPAFHRERSYRDELVERGELAK